jgi:hypothetical protein
MAAARARQNAAEAEEAAGDAVRKGNPQAKVKEGKNWSPRG